MATTTPLQAFPIPQGPDASDIPLHFSNLAKAIEKKVVQVYASATARDTALAANGGAVEGMRTYLSDVNRTYVYDGAAWVLVEPLIVPRVHGVADAAQNHNTSSTWEKVYLTGEAYDTDAMLSPGGSTSRITCKTAGLYCIFGQVFFEPNANGVRMLQVRKGANGDSSAGTGLGLGRSPALEAAGVATVINLNFDVQLAVNEYIEMFAYQNSGGTLAFGTSGNYQTYLQARWTSA